MTTKQIELRTEIARKRIVMARIAQPYDRVDRVGTAVVALLLCVGAISGAVVLCWFLGAR